MYPHHPDWPTLIGALITLAFIALAAYIVRTAPANSQARVLTATATLMAAIPAVLFALLGR
jgi:hypothetical protein